MKFLSPNLPRPGGFFLAKCVWTLPLLNFTNPISYVESKETNVLVRRSFKEEVIMTPFRKYVMCEQEKAGVKSFLNEIKKILPSDRLLLFRRFIAHLCKIQDPYNKEYPLVDSITHGIEVARICIMKKPDLSESLILSAIGHDWDRACGENRIKSQDFPNTKKGNDEYKKKHAENSAMLFRKEMEKFFEADLVEKVHTMILNHEFGGDGEMGILDLADGMIFFSAYSSGYYRNGRIYRGDAGEKLSAEALETERKKAFVLKVKFMTESLSAEDRKMLIEYIMINKEKYAKNVWSEIKETLNI